MPMVSIVFYRDGTRIGDRLINWWTRSPFSHCELVIEGVCMSSSILDGGVRAKRINLSSSHWEIIELPWANAGQIGDYFVRTDGEPYNWWGLIRSQIFNRTDADIIPHASFCSEWCASALGLPRPASYNPGALREWVIWLNQQYLAAQLCA